MDDKLEKRLKEFLPYIIVIGIIYLLVPALLFMNTDFAAYLVLIGILPLTALGCCAHYSYKKKNDLLLAFVAPLFFLPAMFLYPIARESLLKGVIYLAAYFLSGYLGLAIGDILSNRGKSKGSKDSKDETRTAETRAERRSERKSEPRKPALEDDRASRPRTRRSPHRRRVHRRGSLRRRLAGYLDYRGRYRRYPQGDPSAPRQRITK